MGGVVSLVVALFFFFQLHKYGTSEKFTPPNKDNTYSLYFKNVAKIKQRYVVRRSEGSAYKNFFLYVEEIYKSTVIYPVKYVYVRQEYPLKDVLQQPDVCILMGILLFLYCISAVNEYGASRKKEIGKKNLKDLCEEKKQLHEHMEGQLKCFCCYCHHNDYVFPLYSHLKYKREKLSFCGKKDKEDIVLTLSCLKKNEKTYHGFFIQQNSNFFMLNVTLHQFDFNDEFFISRNVKTRKRMEGEKRKKKKKKKKKLHSFLWFPIFTTTKDKSAMERKTYILDSTNSEIDDEVFNVKLRFPVERTYRGDSIKGSYLFLDADIFKERVTLEDSFVDEGVLEGSLVLSSNNVDEHGKTCNKVLPYPSVWDKEKGFCLHKRNHCFNKQLSHFVRLENQLNEKKKTFYNYVFFVIRKSYLRSHIDIGETQEGRRIEEGNDEVGNLTNGQHGNDDESSGRNCKDEVNLLMCIERNFYIGLEKHKNNFIEVKSHNGEELYISDGEKKGGGREREGERGESVSFVHPLSNCYDFDHLLKKDCTVYVSVWNIEDVDKEVEISINCEKEIVKDVSTLKRKMTLCRKCENTVVINFEPIRNLLLTPCTVLITKDVPEEVATQEEAADAKEVSIVSESEGGRKKRGNIRERMQRRENGEAHILFEAVEGSGSKDTAASNTAASWGWKKMKKEEGKTKKYIITNAPITFEVPKEVLQRHIKQLNFLQDADDSVITYKRKFINFMKKAENIAKIILLFFFLIAVVILVIPSISIFKNFSMNTKWFHKLKTIRMLILWKIHDIGRVIIKKVPYKLLRFMKKVTKGVVKLISNVFLKFRKNEHLIDHMYRQKQERQRKNDEKKKASMEKRQRRKKEKEELRRSRYQKLLENEKRFEEEMEEEARRASKKKRENGRAKKHRDRKQLERKHIERMGMKKKHLRGKTRRHTGESTRECCSPSCDSDNLDLEKNYTSSPSESRFGSPDDAQTGEKQHRSYHSHRQGTNRKKKLEKQNGGKTSVHASLSIGMGKSQNINRVQLEISALPRGLQLHVYLFVQKIPNVLCVEQFIGGMVSRTDGSPTPLAMHGKGGKDEKECNSIKLCKGIAPYVKDSHLTIKKINLKDISEFATYTNVESWFEKKKKKKKYILHWLAQ
ncbi:conserved Plasmodium protein, unknown function [Plasmodium ovale curtisi]|uniref:Uncharacterized protein n=1 Tax=Plasmodium ovale curtisi TaxID=864141 RepID=A0A1A8VPW0_PLAOA|nr:conserved Plasmodium protein, unknown function [Plasmodium ovale curtisi]